MWSLWIMRVSCVLSMRRKQKRGQLGVETWRVRAVDRRCKTPCECLSREVLPTH